MSRAFCVPFFGIMVACSGLAAQASNLESVQQRILEAWNRHRSVTVRMQMESHHVDEDATRDGRGAGTIEVLRKGEQYVERTQVHTELKRTAADPGDSPFLVQDVTIIVDGESEYLIREGGGQKYYVKRPINPGISIVPQMVIQFQTRTADLKALPEETIDGQKVWVIEGLWREADPKTGTARTVLYFLQDSGALRRKEGYDKDGAKLETIDYTDFQFDLDLDPQRFVLDLPPGATLIDKTQKRAPTTTQATQPGEPASRPAESPIRGYLQRPTSRPTDSAPAAPPSDTPDPKRIRQ